MLKIRFYLRPNSFLKIYIDMITRLNITQIEESLELIKQILASTPAVSFAYLYGSALLYQRGDQSVSPRDIDIALFLTGGDLFRTELDLQMRFHNLTGFPPEILDVRSLNGAPLSIAIKIITEGELIFCRQSLFHADYLEKIAGMYRQLEGFIEVAYA